jgi:predicted patatin/cPLA2 family phospholipase
MTRSLVLSGGGAKIGWASGALQVLLDEADMKFDHIDATSGAMFNLSMLLSGQSATFVAEAWANLSPREFVSLYPWYKYLMFWKLPALATQESARLRIMPKWGIDVDKIRACTEINNHPVVATFNACDFNAKRVVTFTQSEMNIDRLLSIDSVPGVLPPVATDGTLYVDAMCLKEANLEEAVRRGADEIWVLWNIEERSEWRGGWWNQLGHIFEICAVGNLYREMDEIAAVNAKVAAGTAKAGQRHITVHVLKPPSRLPVGYLFYRNKAQMRPVIESGKAYARQYLAEHQLSAVAGP